MLSVDDDEDILLPVLSNKNVSFISTIFRMLPNMFRIDFDNRCRHMYSFFPYSLA